MTFIQSKGYLSSSIDDEVCRLDLVMWDKWIVSDDVDDLKVSTKLGKIMCDIFDLLFYIGGLSQRKEAEVVVIGSMRQPVLKYEQKQDSR